jgi:hypothetical protein
MGLGGRDQDYHRAATLLGDNVALNATSTPASYFLVGLAHFMLEEYSQAQEIELGDKYPKAGRAAPERLRWNAIMRL